MREVVARLADLDEEFCIFVKRPWTLNSRADTYHLQDDGGTPEEPGKRGLDYFLEVHVAKEVLEDSDMSFDSVALEVMGARLIEYAERDA